MSPPLPGSAPYSLPLSPLVGRQHEFALLTDRLHSVSEGHGGVVLVSGEAGIGKSRLVAEAVRAEEPRRTLLVQAHCYESDQSIPYAPLIGAAHALVEHCSPDTIARILEPHARDLARFLPNLSISSHSAMSTTEIDPAQQRYRLFQGLSALVEHTARDTPVVVVIEDLHWSDETTLQYLLYLSRRIATQAALLVATYRSDEVHPTLRHVLAELDRLAHTTELALGPLGMPEIDSMLRRMFDLHRPLRRDFLQAIAALTEGNPLFIEETVKSLAACGDIVFADIVLDQASLERMRIPRSVQDMIHQRTRRLSHEASRALSLAATIGRRFEVALVQAVLQYDERTTVSAMKELVAAQLIIEESADSFSFRHALIQQAILSQLLIRERRAAHRAIADILKHRYVEEPDRHVAELAYHYYRGGHWEEARVYARRAGEQSMALDAPYAAIEQFTCALESEAHLALPPSSQIYRARGRNLATVGEFERARVDLETALQASVEAEDQRTAVQVLLDLGLLWSGRDYARAGTYLQDAVTRAQALGDTLLYAHSLNRLGNWFANTGQPARSLDVHGEALRVFQSEDRPAGTAETYDLLGIANLHCGDVLAATTCFSQAITLFRDQGDQQGLSSSLVNRACVMAPYITETLYSAFGTREDCLRDVSEALRLARQMDWIAGEAHAERLYGSICTAFGELGPALTHAHEALRLATDIDHQQWTATAHAGLGVSYYTLLMPDRAIEHLETALGLAHEIHSDWWIGNISAWLAVAHLLTRDFNQAESVLAAVMAHDAGPRHVTERRLAWVWGMFSTARGEPEVALAIADHLLATVPGDPIEQAIPELLQLRGEALFAMGRHIEAEEALDAALLGASERQQQPLLWQIARSLGHTRRSLKRREQAEHAYQISRDISASIAATIPDPALRDHFLTAARATIPCDRPSSPQRRQAALPGGLTSRERDVALLIAQGKMNREIAEMLFIGEGTVATHVKHILAKLDATSRTQVAAWMITNGVPPAS